MKHFLFLIAIALALSFSMCKSPAKGPKLPVAAAESSVDQLQTIEPLEYNVESLRTSLDVRIDLCDSQSSMVEDLKRTGRQRPAELDPAPWAIPASDPIPRQNGPPE